MNNFLDSELSQKEPSKKYLENAKKSLAYIHAISYLAGKLWIKLKTEQDNKTAEKIKSSKVFSGKLEDNLEEYFTDFNSYNLMKFAFPEIPKLLPIEALNFLAEKLGIKIKSYFDKIEKILDVKIDVIAKLAFYDNAKHLKDFISSSLESGESLQKAIKRLGKKDLLDKIGITDKNKYYLETVIRTNEVTAMSAGERNASMQSEYVEFYQYIAIIDPRTTEVCKDLDEIVKRKDDQLWDTHLPPNHFNCRSRVITFSKNLAKAINLKESKRTSYKDPEDNFNVDPSKTWSMPTKDMRKRLADHTGVDYKDIPKGSKFVD